MNRFQKLGAVAAAVVLVSVAGAAGASWALDKQGAPASGLVAPANNVSTRALTGGGVNETTFTEINPCRLVDTRSTGGKIAAGATRIFTVASTGPAFAAQGGKANGCGIPAGATSIEATFSAIDAGDGFLRVWPANAAEPNATFMNFTPTFNASNTGTVAINKCPSICFIGRDLAVKAFGASTHVVVDVNGYYERKMAAYVFSDGTLFTSNRAVSAVRTGLGTYEVTFDRNISNCIPRASRAAFGGTASAVPRSGNLNGVIVLARTDAGALADSAIYVEVTC